MPNATPIFVGREAERARLAELLTIAPVTVVWGLGGLGKTSLVLRAVHERLGGDTSRALFVSLSAADASPRVAVDVLRALCTAEGIRAVDWQALLGDEQALVETAIDLAERGPYIIVMDDLQHAEATSTVALLRTVNRYARASRWVATSRVDWPVPELDGQRLQLGTMSEASLVELARRLDGDLDASSLEALVRRAAGSPWRMRLALGSGAATPASGDVLQGLGTDAIELMLALAPVEVALRKSVLAGALADTPPAVWSELERRGIIEGRGGGWRLHDMARVLVRETWDAARLDSYAERMAALLAASDDAAAWLEALRLSLTRGAHARALELLAARGAELFAAGYAPELWRLVEPLQDPAFACWRLRSGVEIGTPEVLARLRPPDDASPEALTLWGQALFAMGRMQESAEVVRRALTAARVAENVAATFDAELLFLHAQALANVSNGGEMLAMLKTLASGQTEVQRAALAAKVYALMGVLEPALAGAQRIAPQLGTLPIGARLLAYLDVLAVHLSLGRMDDAQDIVDRIGRECGEVSMALYSSRYLLVLRTAVATHLGRFAEAHAHLDQVLPFTGRSAGQRPILVSQRFWLRLFEGDLAGIEGQIDQVIRELVAAGNLYFVLWGHVLESWIDRARGRAEMPRLEDLPPLTGANGHLLRVYRLVHAARWGEAPGAADVAFLDGLHRAGYLWAVGRLAPAFAALLAGDEQRAIHEATSAVHALTSMGNHLYASEAAEGLADILLVAGRHEELARVAADLAAKGRDFPSPRLARVAELHQMAARGPLDPALLERLATSEDVSPVTCRRARALIGGSASLDRIDARVVAELGRRARVTIGSVGAKPPEGGDWQPGWGLDGLRRAVWLPDGRVVPFEEHPIRWAALDAIARLGGSASREAIIPVIWPGERYDPLVHNNRLNPAIRKIRLAIEDDPSKPTRLVTTPDGYGFGEAEPVRWSRVDDHAERANERSAAGGLPEHT
ncbi:MAG: AAA family ATPase [Deltaproteobacteria bacterium]|nr:AAA family ATPase [Deltaproteobacteria bacterium]